MSRNLYLVVGAVAAVVMAAACTVTDDTGEGGGGSTSSGTGGTTSGTGGGTGGTTSGTGGGGGCASCLDMLVDDNVTSEDMCTESAALWDALSLCVCGDGSGTAGLCEVECAESCGLGSGGSGGMGGGGGAGGAPMSCEDCTQTQCSTDFNACSGDI